MKDHSVQGYLNRRSTQELHTILDYCIRQKEKEEDYAMEIREIENILRSRQAQQPNTPDNQ